MNSKPVTGEYARERQVPRREALGTLAAVAAGAMTVSPRSLFAAETDKPVRLITRADDLGGMRSLNHAVIECVDPGIVRNASVMATTPYTAEAAKTFAAREDICFGLHSVLTSEWDDVRWGPVAPKKHVPSLLQEDGTLHQFHAGLKGVNADEALIELDAQLARIKKLGFKPKYVDSHMGAVTHVPELPEKFAAWCAANDLFDYRDASITKPPGVHGYGSVKNRRKPDDFPDVVLSAIKKCTPGEIYLLNGHPAYNDAETQKLGHDGYADGAVANNLNLERLVFTDPRIIELCESDAVELVRYDEL
ncbi:ChbG/HpnK family deacetylase [Stratiformator vulcanicus]|uniref:YdjC-like protein n=1 Tax=Stratiformator vulcanicus TaxID=2527980 RepID=A0A517QVR1_9PLAN|nr:ChbG/HpnK family deacetylase [Stratiformator vulcanicus]QDT35700.1 hypothetical protein Pan189_00530 [Stratiformator vulcanicus]